MRAVGTLAVAATGDRSDRDPSLAAVDVARQDGSVASGTEDVDGTPPMAPDGTTDPHQNTLVSWGVSSALAQQIDVALNQASSTRWFATGIGLVGLAATSGLEA